MSVPDAAHVQTLFREHLAELPFWTSVANHMADVLRAAVRHTGVHGKVEARAKSTGSVIGKVYRKPEYTDLAAFGDLAGARVLVPFASDVDLVAAELHSHPDLEILKDEHKIRQPDELRYQARHLDVAILTGIGRDQLPPERVVRCEIQLQTLAQGLWAGVSHLVTYKKDLPDDVRTLMNRLLVLCELFDDESSRTRDLALASADSIYLIASDLQRYFYSITGELPDLNQSVAMVELLRGAITPAELADYPSILDAFITSHGERLRLILTDRPEARGLIWLLRPESILIFERINRRRSLLAQVWQQNLPMADLDSMKAIWGPDPMRSEAH